MLPCSSNIYHTKPLFESSFASNPYTQKMQVCVFRVSSYVQMFISMVLCLLLTRRRKWSLRLRRLVDNGYHYCTHSSYDEVQQGFLKPWEKRHERDEKKTIEWGAKLSCCMSLKLFSLFTIYVRVCVCVKWNFKASFGSVNFVAVKTQRTHRMNNGLVVPHTHTRDRI